MRPIVIRLSAERKRLLKRAIREARRWRLRRSILIILSCAQGWKVKDVASLLGCGTVTVWRVKKRFLAEGLEGLKDRRRTRSGAKATRHAAELLCRLVRASPQDFGLRRSTWTRALLAQQLYRQSRVRLSITAVGRLLARIGARWNRARPVVSCPWPQDKRKERLEQIEAMLANLPANEIALFEDEVDIHLNPKIGFDWMMRGEQKQIITPGQNAKRHIAGTLDPVSGELVWVRGDRKDSALFILLLDALARTYKGFKRIHLILDNYCTHKSNATGQALEKLRGKVQLQFLPPYCPQENKMELIWLHLHRNVTYNHQLSTIEELLQQAEDYLAARSRQPFSSYRKAA